MNPRISDWKGLRVWVVGASTGIGAALLSELLPKGARLAVSARREPALVQAFEQAAGRSRQALESDGHLVLPADVCRLDELRAAHERLMSHWGGLDVVIWVAGTYAPMQAQTFDLVRARSIVDTNLGGVLNGLSLVLPMFLAQRRGHITIVGSVAGYSGLPKALVYGPTKAALINLCESLYLDLHPLGIGVTLVSPGFVETPLTAGSDFHMPAIIKADEAARRIVAGLELGEFDIHFPHRFTLVLKLVRLLPYRLYMALIARTTNRKNPPAVERGVS